MKIHEYQAAELLSAYGVPVPGGMAVKSAREAAEAARALGEGPCVLKAQVHTGGRGKAGGIRKAGSPEEAGKLAEQMLGSRLVTRQTGPEGKQIRCLYVTRCVGIKKEYYISFTVDGAASGAVMIVSSEGGTEIEETAEKSPEKIIRVPVDVCFGLRPYQARWAAERIGVAPGLCAGFIKAAEGLYRLFVEKDCSLVEVNPLVETDQGEFMALDAKANFDPNALFRHRELDALRDLSEEDPRETEAAKYGLSYIPLSGDIGCVVNGAGLAMATMDIIRSCGGEPANFLDVGGGASAEKVAGAFRILLSDPNVKCLLINIFGGIMKCDIIAEGILTAARETGLRVPVVARLEGTNAEAGKKLLLASGLHIRPAGSMDEAARTAVAMSKGREAQA